MESRNLLEHNIDRLICKNFLLLCFLIVNVLLLRLSKMHSFFFYRIFFLILNLVFVVSIVCALSFYYCSDPETFVRYKFFVCLCFLSENFEHIFRLLMSSCFLWVRYIKLWGRSNVDLKPIPILSRLFPALHRKAIIL